VKLGSLLVDMDDLDEVILTTRNFKIVYVLKLIVIFLLTFYILIMHTFRLGQF
jgi:hypothetical protein